MLSYEGPKLDAVVGVVLAVIPLIIAAILWQFPLLVSRTILKPEMDQEVELLQPTSFLAIIISGIAVYTLYSGVVDAVYWTSVWFMKVNAVGVPVWAELGVEAKANCLATAVEVLVSLVLLVKARRVARLLVDVQSRA